MEGTSCDWMAAVITSVAACSKADSRTGSCGVPTVGSLPLPVVVSSSPPIGASPVAWRRGQRGLGWLSRPGQCPGERRYACCGLRHRGTRNDEEHEEDLEKRKRQDEEPGHLALAAAKCRHMTTIHHLAQRGSLKACPAPGTGHAAGRDMDRMTQPGLI